MKREKILCNSIYSVMSKTVLALESNQARGSSSEFTVEVNHIFSLRRTLIINWH